MNDVKTELQSIVKLDAKIKSLDVIASENRENKNINSFKGINTQIKELRKKRDAVVDKILSLDGDMCSVLIYRYVNGLTIEETSKAMNYSVATINRLHKNAIEKLSR